MVDTGLHHNIIICIIYFNQMFFDIYIITFEELDTYKGKETHRSFFKKN